MFEWCLIISSANMIENDNISFDFFYQMPGLRLNCILFDFLDLPIKIILTLLLLYYYY